jgi:hypothetical protein
MFLVDSQPLADELATVVGVGRIAVEEWHR